MRTSLAFSAVAGLASLLVPTLHAQTVDFDRDIRPILNDHCAACHGGVKKSGGFSVISRELLFSETDSAQAAVIAGDADNSLLMERITADDPAERMPPEGHDALTADQVQRLRTWISEGAQWPVHWAYAALPPLPDPAGFQGQHPIDWFVQQELAARKIEPSPAADAPTLLRRLSLDITGLLPDPDAARNLQQSPEPFAADSKALLAIIDSLLASPHYGERWARHWLDEARYADSEGYEKDSVKNDAYHFRDWVISAFNDDMPFDEFTRKQIAGDLLPNRTPRDLIATKFHLQTQFNLEGGVDSEEDRTKRIIDRVGTFGSVWLASSVACCQCHDHPYDSFRQEDFYRLYAFFNNADFAADFLGPEPKDADKKRTERAKKIAELSGLLKKQLSDKNFSDTTQSQLSRLRGYDNGAGFVRYLQERSADRRATWVFTRGDFQRPMKEAGEIAPDVPAALGGLSPDRGTVNRLDLADWLVSKENPVTARVAVNKVWMHLFGEPLAAQPQEFGSRGAAPTHPELLDYLARWFVDEAHWSQKKLIRHIVTSRTWQQSSDYRSDLGKIDPDNQLLARQNRYRVEAEILRDISLQASGLLSTRIGGPSVFPPLPAIVAQQTYAGSNKYKVSTGENRYRRGLYTFFRRTAIDPNLALFDCPDSSLTRARRDRSNNPLQAMATLHNEVFHEAAQHFAKRLLDSRAESAADDTVLNEGFLLTVGRNPTPEERQPLKQLLADARGYYASHSDDAAELIGQHAADNVEPTDNAAWIAVTRVLLNSDEFLTRN